MRWPDIFFKARPTGQLSKPSAPKEPDASTPPGSSPAGGPAPASASTAATPAVTTPVTPGPADVPPSRLPVFKVTLPTTPASELPTDNEVLHDMAEADTLRAMSRTAGIRLVRRDHFTSPASNQPGAAPGSSPSPESSGDPFTRSTPATATAPVPSSVIQFPSTGISTSASPPPLQPVPPAGVTPNRPRSSPNINLSTGRILPTAGTYPSAMTIVRRKMKMADVARIVLPPRRDDSAGSAPPTPEPAFAPEITPPPTPTDAAPTPARVIIPPSFGVPVAAGTLLQGLAEEKETTEKPVENTPPAPLEKFIEASATEIVSPPSVEPSTPPAPASSDSTSVEIPATPEPLTSEPVPAAIVSEPEISSPPADPIPASSAVTSPQSTSTTLGRPREKREFVLSNGERIIGHILSETPEAIYLDHGTLGVLTIPRNQIALRPVEIILINGDRVVGDIVAETADSLFVKHASLGILTVPRNQRSSRVVEVILKDGDRILGEVLGETENFTVIRSATLGTVAVPHNKVAMLHRRAEQVEMKSLPPPSNPSPS